MLNKLNISVIAVAMFASGCATQGSWMGAEAEKTYDKELEARRLAEVKNNDDYYEIHKDGRIYVLADAKSYQIWLTTDEIPLVVTQIGVGPKGETVKLALTKNEAKAMEKKAGYAGGAQNLYEGKVEGLEKGFFGFVVKDERYYVFDNWKDLNAFRKNGSLPATAQPAAAVGPNGEPVVFARQSNEMVARFRSTNNLK